MPSKSNTRLVIAGVLLAIYVVFVLTVVFWPTPVDRGYESAIRKVLEVLHRNGVPTWFGYHKLEFTANIAMFVPLGFLGALVLPRRFWWVTPLIGAALSAGIELAQGAFLSQRYSSALDVAANTLGVIIGTLLAVALRAIVYRRDQRMIERALWERSL